MRRERLLLGRPTLMSLATAARRRSLISAPCIIPGTSNASPADRAVARRQPLLRVLVRFRTAPKPVHPYAARHLIVESQASSPLLVSSVVTVRFAAPGVRITSGSSLIRQRISYWAST